MSANSAIFQTDLHHLELLHRGKVRDVYAAGPHDLLFIACDRISAFDVVLPTPIPGKGRILTELSRFWFEHTRDIVPNHLTSVSPLGAIGDHPELEALASRSMVVQKLKPLPCEAVVRGYLAGSGWKDYQRTGQVCGHRLPPKMELAQRLPEPIFTPATKASEGHDENITMGELESLIGRELAGRIREVSLALYRHAVGHARERGIIIADSKFEFGLDASGDLVLMDELFTPDSSRFWPREEYRVGQSPPSYDKQFVRDYLETLDWDKSPPGPPLPEEIVRQTQARYAEALEVLTR